MPYREVRFTIDILLRRRKKGTFPELSIPEEKASSCSSSVEGVGGVYWEGSYMDGWQGNYEAMSIPMVGKNRNAVEQYEKGGGRHLGRSIDDHVVVWTHV